jgi:cytochrome c oxidase subunit 4
MYAHVIAKKVYFLVLGALIALTALTTGVAYIDLGVWNTVVALTIGVSKATLVALFFMHLRWSSHLMRIVLLAALLWLAILIGLTTTDFFTRGWTPVPGGWQTSFVVSPDCSPVFAATKPAKL